MAFRVEYYRTSAGNLFGEYIDRRGQVHWRKNGRFASTRSFLAGKRSAKKTGVARNPVGSTVSIPDLSPLPPSSPRIAEEIDGDWIAGPEMSQYFPGVTEGDIVPRTFVSKARFIRARERNLWAFSRSPVQRDLPEEEIRRNFIEFLDAIDEAGEDKEERRIVIFNMWGLHGSG